MEQNVIVWDIETVPDLAGFAAANGLNGKSDKELLEARGLVTLIKDSAASSPVTAYKLRRERKVLRGLRWQYCRSDRS